MKNLIRIILFSIFFFSVQHVFSQTKGVWAISDVHTESSKILQRTTSPKHYKNYKLDINKLKKDLLNAPLRKSKFSKSKTIVTFPDASGKLIKFAILEAPVMASELAKKFPNNKSYMGRSLSDKSLSIRFSVNQLGVYAMIFKAGKKVEYIDPINKDRSQYMVYRRLDLPKKEQGFVCLTKETKGLNIPPTVFKIFNANDAKLRTFRLALATTHQYSQYHVNQAGLSLATNAQKKAAVMAAITTTMTRVNGIFENDVALTMVLVANNDQLIYLNSFVDPYTNSDGSAMLGENQTNIDNIIGTANYDIGHVFSTGGGGVAVLNSPCTSSKAQGVTGQTNPVGDAFDIDFVAHEMGHQFGATHTFNGDAGSCGGGNRTNSTAVEPGSGSTIMAYAGICFPQNVQNHSDAYFHSVSIQQMYSNIFVGLGTCAVQSSLVNNLNAPLVNAGSDVIIPKSTPFKLTAVASDADNNTLTYAWEQTDTQVTTIPPVATATGGAVFRSVSPTISATRYFPDINTVLSGQTANAWEVVPSVARTLNFDITVRDNVSGGGQTARDAKRVTVDGTSGPFVVTSQSTAVTYDVGSTQSINWNVANTNLAPVNCTHVDILLSTDGGQTYPITLASNVQNNGSVDVLIPNNPTATARIMVAGVNNAFFNVNTSDFAIQEAGFALLPQKNSTDACSGSNIVINYTFNSFAGFSETTTFSALNLPSGVNANFNPISTSVNGTNIQVTLSGITDAVLGSNTITIQALSPSLTRTVNTNLQVYSSSFNTQTLLTPSNGSIGVSVNPMLTWASESNAKTYDLQVATDMNFSTIISSINTGSTNYTLSNLIEATAYYWRVRSVNPCGTGNFSSTSVFVTYQQVCNTTSYSGTPIAIPDNSTIGASSTLSIPDNVVITDINIGVNITHAWIGDVKLNVTSPANKTVQLLASAFCAPPNMNVVFDDSGTNAVCNVSAPGYSGITKPAETLSVFNGDNAQGNWVLFAEDQGANDIGSIISWNVEVCSVIGVPLAVKNTNIENFRMWPNPSNGLLNISMPNLNADKISVQIFDTLGRDIKHFNYNSNVIFNEILNLKGLQKGVLFIKIIKGNQLLIKKIILN
ncbi:MAG: M12 family metallo-peptidase [Flavobacteriaceae bacterium]|nr:M12 family metallo-peptidase [Flavobacteriaceae bacterium]